MPLSPSKLKAARGDRTQAEVATAAGITQSYYARLEGGGIDDPPLSTIEALAGAVGRDVCDLLTQRRRGSRVAGGKA